MNKQEATQFIQQVFQSPFNEQRFGRFAAELLNEIEAKPFSYSGPYIKDAYKHYVQQYKRIGTYTDPSGDEVDILIVHLKQGTTLERARTMQRNFIAHYLRDRGDRDAALVAYYSDDDPDWRFSLVRMAYQRVQDEASGKIKVVEELTPARRYSFLVGETEPSHTAQQQFITLLTEERSNPTLDDLEAAFNLETVTKEFFEKYKGLFLRLYEALDGLVRTNPSVRAEFTTKALDTRHFAKKLLGQIVFLYFLQKKGWLGVQPGAAWGSGPKDFLRRLFDGQWGAYTNFFNERLEPLFYEALARQRADNLYAPLGCQIPFLNGGLFEPLQGYDWQGVDILLDNELFVAIFDTFDLYNFTVRENEPLEKEVAVDPEMLGKVFENLLEVTDRKSKGAFYTPREIVQYMCQESLINYLDTALNLQEVPVVAEAPTQATLFGDTPPHQATLTTWARRERVPREELAKLIRKGEQVKEFEAAKESGTKAYAYQLAEVLRRHAGLLDEALANIKICDPAIGSGAFPVGMMQEIVRAREVLTVYLGDDTRNRVSQRNSVSNATTAYTTDRSAYAFKRHAIQESIYGVDIDPGAVDIAKLRLWLSLVVDEEDYRTIKPLPNLDYKIVCGNSLLRTEKTLFNNHLLHTLQEEQAAYFVEINPEQKQAQHEKIDDLIEQITGGAFDFEIYFSGVFEAQGGFDVVIGNPPYGAHFSQAEKNTLKKRFHYLVDRIPNSFQYFMGLSYEIAVPHGIVTLIVPNEFLFQIYMTTARKFFLTNSQLLFAINVGENVFEAIVPTCVVSLKKTLTEEDYPIHIADFRDSSLHELADSLYNSNLLTSSRNTIINAPNAAFSFDIATANFISRLSSTFEKLENYCDDIANGISTSCDEVYIVSSDFATQHNFEDSYMKPCIRGGQFVKYWCPQDTGDCVLYVTRDFKPNRSPNIYKYLLENRELLIHKSVEKRAGKREWYILFRGRYEELFDASKIIVRQTGDHIVAAPDHTGYYAIDSVNVVKMKSRHMQDVDFFVGLLNSSLISFFYQEISQERGRVLAQVKPSRIKSLPVSFGEQGIRDEISNRVRRIRGLVNNSSSNDATVLSKRELLIKEIDYLVYQLYGLTDAEIALIEAHVDR